MLSGRREFPCCQGSKTVIHLPKLKPNNKESEGVSNQTTLDMKGLGSISMEYEDEVEEYSHSKTEEDSNYADDLEEEGSEKNNLV